MNRFETLRYQQERARLQATLREIRFIRRRLGSMEKTIAALLAHDQASPGGHCALVEPAGIDPDEDLTPEENREVQMWLDADETFDRMFESMDRVHNAYKKRKNERTKTQ